MRFVDTNVLLYACSPEEGKAAIARRVMRDRGLGLSTQVLAEFYYQATRPTRQDALSHDRAVAFVERLSSRRVQPITVSIVRAAMVTRERFQISYWDAAILEAARTLGCEVVLSEDLSDGMDYGGVRVENPFRDVV